MSLVACVHEARAREEAKQMRDRQGAQLQNAVKALPKS